MEQNIIQERKIISFLAVWDENKGPTIIETYPEENSLDLEEVTIQIFSSFQTVFGTDEDVVFDRTNLVLPFKSHKRIAKILLDSIPDKKVRGGKLPFITVILVPIEFPEDHLKRFNPIQNDIIEQYSEGKAIILEKYDVKIAEVTEKLCKRIHREGEALFKGKKYKVSVELFRNALDLAKIIENEEKIEISYNSLSKGILKYSKQLFLVGNRLYREGKFSEAEKNYILSIDLAEEIENFSLFKQIRKNMYNNYVKWSKKLCNKGDKALKARDLKVAHDFYHESLILAEKAKNPKLLKKYTKKLNKTPNLEEIESNIKG